MALRPYLTTFVLANALIASQFRSVSRRKFLKYGGAGAAGLAGVAGLSASFPGGPQVGSVVNAATNPITVENANAGTTSWQLQNPSTNNGRQIKGYASATSVNKGGSIDLYITVGTTGQKYKLEVYRMGWYGGTGGRLMTTVTNLTGTKQTMPTLDSFGMAACKWTKSYTLNIPTTWTTGQYLIRLVNTNNNYDNYIHFVVRDDTTSADLLFPANVTTYHAYNPFGGKSLYTYNSSNSKAAVKVSLDRPYADDGAGDFYAWEMPMIHFLEKNGYNVSYCSIIDMHTDPSLLSRFKGLLFVGHSEYWSKEMYDRVQAARDAGIHLGYFGANEVYWQIRFENSSTGVPNRVIVGYKETYTNDPLYANVATRSQTTAMFRDTFIGRDENQLVGVMYDSYRDGDIGQDYIVNNANHWVYAGTGFANGTKVTGIVGYEWDKRFSNGKEPAGLVQLSNSPVTDFANVSSTSNASIYQAASGAWVFCSGSMYWTFGLDFTGYQVQSLVNAGIQQTTINILNKFINSGTPVPTPTPTSTPTNTPTNTPVPPTNTPTSTPTNTPVPPTNTPTNTPVPPTNTPTNTPTATSTATAIATATATFTATPTNTPVPPTNTPTNTPVPPTNTPVPPTNTPTNTPVPPTATPTSTPVPPTATPTSTPVPPTATATPTPSPLPTPGPNQISNENALPGTTTWQLDLWADDTTRQIKGYASATSVNKGGSVDLFVTVNTPQTYTIEVYRIGWYGGLGGRLMTTLGPFNGTPQTVPAPDSFGTVSCNWTKATTLTIPASWVTGQYLLKLINAQGYQNYILLTVRDDAATADLMFQSSVNTFQAYNNFGGKSLYGYSSTNSTPAVKVSFNRPYNDSGSGYFLRWELGMIRFIEQKGYNVKYCTDIDVHTTPTLLNSCKGLVMAGHIEYCTKEMFDNTIAARNAGKHLGFFAANTYYWQARLENTNRTLVCYKYTYTNDPMYASTTTRSLTTTLWRDPVVNRPENQMIGVMFDSAYNWEQGYPYVVQNSNHWVYAGTGFSNGDSVPGIVGYEWDNVNNNGLTPAGLVTLSASPVVDSSNIASTANSSIYQAASGAWVFGAGTVYWVYGCDYNAYNTRNLVDARIQRTTLNILNKFVGLS